MAILRRSKKQQHQQVPPGSQSSSAGFEESKASANAATQSTVIFVTEPSSGKPGAALVRQKAVVQSLPSIDQVHQLLLAVPDQVCSTTLSSHGSGETCKAKSLKKLKSVADLLSGDGAIHALSVPTSIDGTPKGTQYLNQGAALYDLVASKFNAVVTMIDRERFSGDEQDLVVQTPLLPSWQGQQDAPNEAWNTSQKMPKGIANHAISTALTSTNYFTKVNLYANSRLSPNLPPLKINSSVCTLLCLAAQYSEHVYTKPSGNERDTHIDADWRTGTKAMFVKSVPVDDRDTIVFAIRGTQTFMDWAVNLNSTPAAPNKFLDDPGNLCHAGYLGVARKMIHPVAVRLRSMLKEDPTRGKCCLLITGHSAGGAVASLLYSHMLSISLEARSELNILTKCFKRVNCVTFGSPPISLLPLQKPDRSELKKSVFLSFVNEGDPVARADKAYIRSLLDLYSKPTPGQTCMQSMTPQKYQPLVSSIGKSATVLAVNNIRTTNRQTNPLAKVMEPPMWPIPEAALSNAGQIVMLRGIEKHDSNPSKKKHIQQLMDQGVLAQIITDDLLRGVIWGDPVCHMMHLYTRRIEILAANAAKGRR